ncbi:alpha-glucosidase/alpha-galactosidase [Paenibacillus beijingensis]|uniref:Alpha-galactosidase n=1 Tax=Paenibacillus beijingensis TaxID=1126833 RepID=A0A0D5NIZ9_9BACL|nr:alpha-glucosidase/alpha-galactosidase [Paenibacillus beijingensis]AJY75344.1 alpha-galactosidase [Paenibacillus beijingensis]
MAKIAFIGAGSTVFAKNVLGDCMLTPALQHYELALFDIDHERLRDTATMLNHLKKTSGSGCAVKTYFDRKEALRGAKFVINAIQVGGYDPCTITDFKIPDKYGLRQTIGDTVGIGGIFRSLRTIPVMLDIAADMEEVAPDALLINYTNPMATLTNVMATYTGVQTIGLCHSVQVCVEWLFKHLNMDTEGVTSTIAGINHMAWLLEVKKDGVDLYPEIKRRAAEKQGTKHHDMVRYELMRRFGYYVTESSEHNAEYYPYFIKRSYPEIIDQLNIPLDEYLRRCQIYVERWKTQREQMVENTEINHERTHEYASYIMESMETGQPFKFGGNVKNKGLITNLPAEACVEVPCISDRSGIHPMTIGDLPPQLAALNRTNINTQLLTIEAAMTRKREYIYQAAFLDPHTSSELSLDEITRMCDEMIEAHGHWLPEYH